MRNTLWVGLVVLVLGVGGLAGWVASRNFIGPIAPDGFEFAAVAATGAFEAETSCFHVGGYDAFIARIRKRNNPWKPKMWLLPWLFPRQRYEHAQTTLDCRSVTYESDGLLISGFMVAPRDHSGGRLPVLIFNRGGNGGFGALTFADAMVQLFPYAEAGYLVLASNYRGSTDHDPDTHGRDEFGGADVRDVEQLLALVDRLPQADPDNIFMLGVSRGAMMSYLVARNTNRIRALAAINGDSDLEASLAFRPEMERVFAARMPDYATRKHELLAERSVMRWAEALPRDMPILLLHGSDDERVDPANGPRLQQRLAELGHPNKLVIYPDDDHFLRRNRAVAVAEVVGWFRANASRVAVSPAESRSAAP